MCRNCFKKDEEIDDEHSDLVRKRKKMQKILGKNFESKSKGLLPVIAQLKSLQKSGGKSSEKLYESVDKIQERVL